MERVGNDDAVLDLSEDVGRIFSITSDNLTINFWPPVLLAAVVVISESELLETFYRILHLRSSFSKGVGASQSIFISLLSTLVSSFLSALVPLVRILHSLWSPLIGQFEVDANQVNKKQALPEAQRTHGLTP